MLSVIFEVVGKKYVSDDVIHSTLLLIAVTEQMCQTLCFYASILSSINSFIF